MEESNSDDFKEIDRAAVNEEMVSYEKQIGLIPRDHCRFQEVRMNDTTKIERISKIERGDLMIDPQLHIVKVEGKEIILYPKEFEVLYLLTQYPGWVLSSEQIFKAVWNEESDEFNTVVCYTICQLRKKLKRPELIQTVRKYGYKFNG